MAAAALDVKQLITLKKGEMFSSGMTRGRKKSMDKVVGLLIEYLKETDANINDCRLVVGYGYDYEEAVRFKKHAELVLREHEYPVLRIHVNQTGAAIGVHTGPDSVGFGIIQRYR